MNSEVARPSVVLVSGQLCTESLWSAQIPPLQALTGVSVAVQREHDNVGDMAQSLLDSMPERFSVVAHAMGGFVAFEVLRRAPSRVASVALLSTLAPNDTPAQTARREGYLRLVGQGRFADVVEERIPMLLHPSRRTDAALVGIARKMAEDTGVSAFLNQQRAIMTRPDSRPCLAGISCPTLVVFGRQDGIVTLEHQIEMQNGVRDSRLEIIEDCGHMLTLERPELVARLLVEWIQAT